LKPKYFMQNYLNVFKGSSKNYSITLTALLFCQAVLVGRIGGKLSYYLNKILKVLII